MRSDDGVVHEADAARVRGALNAYSEARRAHHRSGGALATAQEVLAARVALVQVLQQAGWSPPARVVAGAELDAALLGQPADEQLEQTAVQVAVR